MQEVREELSVYIDRTRAQELLVLNTENYRDLKPRRVDHYDRLMDSGQWRGKTVIRFVRKPSGRLVLSDGQHRLHAIVQGDHVVEATIVFDDDISVMDVINSGYINTVPETLTHHGEENVSPLAAGLRWGIGQERGTLPFISRITPIEALTFLDANPGYRDSVRETYGLRARPLCVRSGPRVWLHYVTSSMAPDWADHFWSSLADGENLDRKNPIRVLRERLILDATNKTAKPDEGRVAAHMIKAWNAYVDGREISLLRWYRTGPYAEDFPTPRGPEA